MKDTDSVEQLTMDTLSVPVDTEESEADEEEEEEEKKG